MHHELYEEMFEMEQRHWWFAAKHRIIASLLRRYLKAPIANSAPTALARVADLGCGCGMMIYKLKDEYDVVGVDGSPLALEFCERRSMRAALGQLPTNIPLERGNFDAVLLLDVLEHVDEDADSVITAVSLLRPGGVMICTVPAYQWLWTKRDEHHHHRRRYSRKGFRQLFPDSLVRQELFSYYNTWLFPLAAVARVTSRIVQSNSNSDSVGDMRMPPAPVNAGMRGIFASERFLLGRVRLPFGLSLIGVFRKL